MPRRDEEQQDQQQHRRADSDVGYIERLVVGYLAGDASIVLFRRRMMVEQPDGMKSEKSEQRELDDPAAPTALPMHQRSGHARFDRRVCGRCLVCKHCDSMRRALNAKDAA